ncbi:ATP-binding protein [Methylobacterium pseudosasicola]|uniref:AAA domain-containing protein n=1 Tax=Methylobacterium pseudosasicola TaxID=582667 RepID=A0A1I4P6W8_9HYPH|nr:ATP-binding protein [Methylobacterium pseudosasicola]SFM23502.1 AAA domain-containing protein [Methylobacterium pseudosasicola]
MRITEIDLDPAARVRANLPNTARRRSRIMEKVRHVYLRTARDTVLQVHFEGLMEDLTERREPEAAIDAKARAELLEGNILVVLGESGAGKSTAIRRLLSKHPLSPNYGRKAVGSFALTVRVPSPCSVGELGKTVLRATGYKVGRSTISAAETWGIVRERLQALGVLVLHLDEFQDAHLTLRADEQIKLRHLLRSLLVDEDYPIGLIVSGQPSFETFLRPDRSSVRRGRWQAFAKLSLPADSGAVTKAAAALAKVADLTVAADFDHAVLPRLVHAGCNMLGITIEEIHDAIRYALTNDRSELDLGCFAEAFALRTGNLAPWNPYLAADYLAVDPTRVLATSNPPPPEEEAKRGKSRKARE